MRTYTLLRIVACAGLVAACAPTIPHELASAREAYRRASTGPAAQSAPAEVHVADQALGQAEKSFKDNPDSYQTRDLAYVAQRKAELAEATASIAAEQHSQSQAKHAYQATQTEIMSQTKRELSGTRTKLAASEHNRQATDQARLAAEQRATEAQAALAKLAAVKEESRGLVITLSGSVLFASDQATLLPEALTRLNQVAEVLLTTRERNLTIEGYTDSQGSDSHNLDLSQRRADAVRTYLEQRGYQPDRMQAHGLGEGRPVASNATVEGRANNRRVEIVIDRAETATR